MVSDNYYNNPYKHVKKINWYESPKEKKLQNFSYYIGWIDASPVGNMILDKYKHKKKIGFDIIFKQITKKIALKLFANVC